MAWFYVPLLNAGKDGPRHHPNEVEETPGRENHNWVAEGASSWTVVLPEGSHNCAAYLPDGVVEEEKVAATQEPEPYVATQEPDPDPNIQEHPEADAFGVASEPSTGVECRPVVPVVGVGFHGQVGKENGGWYHTAAAYLELGTGNREIMGSECREGGLKVNKFPFSSSRNEEGLLNYKSIA
nr:hypothetical protein Iba_chr15bCG8710 [Ipomoea batatas]